MRNQESAEVLQHSKFLVRYSLSDSQNVEYRTRNFQYREIKDRFSQISRNTFWNFLVAVGPGARLYYLQLPCLLCARVFSCTFAPQTAMAKCSTTPFNRYIDHV